MRLRKRFTSIKIGQITRYTLEAAKGGTLMERGIEELLELIRLTERVSVDIRGLTNRMEILDTVVRPFRDSKHFQIHILMLDDQTGALRIAATSFSKALVKLGEMIAGISMETFRVDLAKAPLMARVLRNNETIQVSTTESLTDLLQSESTSKILQSLNYEGTMDVLTGLYSNGEPLGILSVTAPGLAEHFIPSLKTLAQHISASFELAEAIEASERARQRYRDLVENLNEIIYAIDLDGDVKYISPNVSLLGYKPEELVGKPFLNAFEEEQANALRARFAKYMSGEMVSGEEEYRLLGKDGATHWIRISSRIAIEDGKAIGLRGSIIDVTNAKTAEERLKKSERILNQTGRMARIGGWEHDLRTGEAVWTRELYEIIGIDPTEQPPGADRHLDYYPPAQRAILRNAYERSMNTGEPFDLELQVLTETGKVIWCRAFGEPVFENGECVKMRGTFQDISDHKLAQIAGAESERKMAMLMSNLSGMVYRCKNDREWTMEYASDGCEELTGYLPDELIDSRKVSYGSLIQSEDRGEVWEAIQQALAEQSPFAFEYRIVTADGTLKWVWEQGQGVFQSDNEVAAIEGFITDITSRHTAEEALKANQEQLEMALDGTTIAVARTVELRDPYTAGHQERVGLLACAIAIEAGYGEPLSQAIRVAGLLHDVGKIAVPSELLSKPKRLTDAEMQLVRSHAEASYSILKEIVFPWPIADMVRQHHERLDGSGYPLGLRGDDICLGGRILAIADVVEAIASHRPYRPALGIGVALDEIERGRGTLFDANVVDACLRLFRQRGLTLETLSEDVCLLR